MLHILCLILKIIGIILVSLLGIVILALSVVLFVPVKYSVDIKNKTIQAKAHWLLHLISAYFVYDGNETDWQIRIAWKKIRDKEERVSEETENSSAYSECEQRQETHAEKSDEKPDKDVKENTKKKTKKNLFSNLKCTIQKICDKMKKLWETKEKISDFITDPVHKQAFRRIKKEIIIMAKRIRPKKLEGYVHFGMEDPYNTGRILAVMSILYPFYGERIEIEPDFEHKVFEGEVHMRGYMHAATFVALLWNLFFDQNVKITYRDYKNLNL